MEQEIKSKSVTRFPLFLDIPAGLTETEIKRRVQAAVIGLSSAARRASVEIVSGDKLMGFIETHLVGG